MTKDQIIKIAKEYTKVGAKKLSQELNCTEQTIFNVVAKLRKLGIAIPRKKDSVNEFKLAVDELKKQIEKSHD